MEWQRTSNLSILPLRGYNIVAAFRDGEWYGVINGLAVIHSMNLAVVEQSLIDHLSSEIFAIANTLVGLCRDEKLLDEFRNASNMKHLIPDIELGFDHGLATDNTSEHTDVEPLDHSAG